MQASTKWLKLVNLPWALQESAQASTKWPKLVNLPWALHPFAELTVDECDLKV